MSKNNRLIEQAKAMARYYHADKNIVDIFSAVILVMQNDAQMSDEDINYFIARIQEELTQATNEGYSIYEKCVAETNFDVRAAKVYNGEDNNED